jgi:hypothetical protein
VCVVILGIIIISVVFLVGVKYFQMPSPHDGAVATIYIPEFFVALGSTALGALAGLLAPQNFRDR